MTEPSAPKPKTNTEIGSGSGTSGPKFPNPRESVNPDSAALKDQWRFAIRQYSKWYSHAWGTAILAGVSFFALGWFIKGQNPLDSIRQADSKNNHGNNDGSPAAEVHKNG